MQLNRAFYNKFHHIGESMPLNDQLYPFLPTRVVVSIGRCLDLVAQQRFCVDTLSTVKSFCKGTLFMESGWRLPFGSGKAGAITRFCKVIAKTIFAHWFCFSLVATVNQIGA